MMLVRSNHLKNSYDLIVLTNSYHLLPFQQLISYFIYKEENLHFPFYLHLKSPLTSKVSDVITKRPSKNSMYNAKLASNNSNCIKA